MRESGPFLSIFSFYLFFFFSFSVGFFFFSVFSFSCCSFFRGLRPPQPQKTMRRASQPSALVNQNLYETKTRAHFIIVGGERNTAFIRICADYLPCAIFLEIGFRLSSPEVRIAYCLGTSGIGVFGWNGETAIIALIRISGIITFFSFFYWQPREPPLVFVG